MATQVSDWSDFDWFIHTYLPYQTIPILKEFATTYENVTGAYAGVKSQEKKDNLVEKVRSAFIRLKNRNELDQYIKVRQMCERVGKPKPLYSYPPPTFGGIPAGGSSSSFHSPSAAPLPNPGTAARYNNLDHNGYRSPHGYNASGSGWGQVPGASNIYAQRGTGQSHTLQDWRPNPMFKATRALTSMEMLPDILHTEGSHTRREKRTTFYIPPDVVDKLQQSKNDPRSFPRYSLRVFCASSDFYRPPHSAYQVATAHVNNQSIPIEYPNNPDISLDHSTIKFEGRGLRGKPGSAPPFDLNKDNRLVLNSARLNTVTMGHTGPTTGKKKEQTKRFWFQVVLAEMTTKEDLLNRLNGLKPMPAKEVIDAALRRIEDDDIVVGASKMTLKDPLSFVRIKRPVRSLECGHGQCFEPQWWLDANTVHPQFLCPLCNKPLEFKDLILDGFFLDILNAVPDSVDEVVLESDYEWHTEDNKYGSAKWLETHPPILPPANGDVKQQPEVTKREMPSPSDTASPSNSTRVESPIAKGKRKAIEILSDSEEDEDVPLRSTTNGQNGIPRPPENGLYGSYHPPSRPAPVRTPSTTASVPPPNNAVIDLTLDSSDEENDAEGSTQPSYFRPPGAGLTNRDAADSIPRLTLRPPPRLPELDTGSRLNLNFAAAPPHSAPLPRYSGGGREYERSISERGGGAHESALTGGGHWSPSSAGPPSAGAAEFGIRDGEVGAGGGGLSSVLYRPPPTKRQRPSASDYMDQDLYDQF